MSTIVEAEIAKYEKGVFSNDDVITYMTVGDPCPHFIQMPPVVDLGEFTHFYDQLYGNYRDVTINSDPDKLLAQKIDLFPFLKNPELQGVVDQLKENYGQQAPGERSTVIYMDQDSFDFAASPIVYGDFSSTYANFGHVLQEGGIPVMDVHTHPWNTFFSVQDFNAMLVSVFKNGQPFTQASAVLCPDYQLLAVATAETPLMSQAVFDQLKDEYSPTDQEEKRLAELSQRRATLEVIVAQNHYDTQVEYDELVLELLAEFPPDDPEIKRRLEIWVEAIKRYNDEEFRPKLARLTSKTLNAYFGYLNTILNRHQIRFARDMNLKLYMATDSAHFKEFSA